MRFRIAVVLSSFAVLVGLAFVHPYGDPRVVPRKGLVTLLQGAAISPEAKQVLIDKCADCHSNETAYPAYSRIAPGSWLIERDIVKAREKMNLSDWETMPADKQEVLMQEIVHVTKSGEMPPLQFRLLHWKSQLTASDIVALSAVSPESTQQPVANVHGDPERGRLVFDKRCTGCHTMEADREGPHLAGVFGRKAGAVSGFSYSAGLKGSGIVWNEVSLEKWLADPDLMIHDNKMGVGLPKAQERADVIAWFQKSVAAK